MLAEYTFTLRRHWWFDVGLAGLYIVANKDALREQRKTYGVRVILDSNSLIFQANSIDELRQFFHACHEHIAILYWNISNANQKEKAELVVYDEQKDELYLAPKRNPIPPIHKVISARSWKGKGEQYKNLPDVLKRRVDFFLEETGKKLWGKNEILLFESPVCHEAEIQIMPNNKKGAKKTCCICGSIHTDTSDISQSAYLLFASKSASRSFHSEGVKPDVICWECNYLSKFTYEAIHYKVEGNKLMIISPNSSRLQQILKLQEKLGANSSLRAFDDQYFMKNIGINHNELLYYAKKPYELLWAFFYDAYGLLKAEIRTDVDNEENLFIQDLLDEILSSPVEINLITLLTKGQTFLTQSLIIYREVGYVFRLIFYLEEQNINLKKIFEDLYDYSQATYENKTLVRDLIFRRILQKHEILREMEGLCFSKILTHGHGMRMKNMLTFIKEYQLIIRRDSMTREQIETAVNLGKQIVLQAKKQLGDDAMRKIKGDLYKLRKTRTASDFLNQLNALQFRYGISVSRHIQEGLIHDVSFEDFRAYCMLGALNIYNSSIKYNKGEKNDEKS